MTTLIPRYQAIAQRMAAAKNCEAIRNDEWAERHQAWVDNQFRNCPHIVIFGERGLTSSGYLRFLVHYLHHDESGYRDGTTEHWVFVKPSLQWGIELNIAGENKNDIKDMLHETLNAWLTELIDPHSKENKA